MDARQLFKAHRFDESVTAYRAQLREGRGDDWSNIDGLADALMAAGDYAEAIPFLERVGVHEKTKYAGSLGRDIQLAVCHWVLGNSELAIKLIRALVIGTRDGKIKFGDLAGGVTQGLMLRYMAATVDSKDDFATAVSYLERLAESKKITQWPGPVAVFALGRVSFDHLLLDGLGVADIAKAKERAITDLLARRHLTNILFNDGVSYRVAGNEVGCKAQMQECASLVNPLIEYEWHLAKGEVS